MTTTRRIATLAAVVAVTLSGLGLSATADGRRLPKSAAPSVAEVPDVARGLIVRTTTSEPSQRILAAATEALGPQAQVATDDLTPRVSVVDFDRVVDAEVAADVAAKVEARGDVVWAIPNRLRRAQVRPPVASDDPLFSQQRSLWDTASARPGAYSIKAPALWRATKGSASTVVAVIDTGITAHPDLAGRTVAGYDFISSRAAARDGNGRDADPTDKGDWNTNRQCPYPGSMPSSWHGTFVAGQIVAAADNGIGISGVAPGAVVQPIRALGRCGGWDSDLLDSIRWASGGAVRGAPANATPAAIVNLSLGGQADSARERRSACRAYDDAARAGRARGSIFIAAAGNEGDDADLAVPASCSQYISVGATSRKGFSAIYSNVGSTVDISAPGGDTEVGGRADSILSLGNRGTRQARGYTYVRYEGTSMAAPQVAGAAALLHGLGVTEPGELTAALYASVSPFRPRSSGEGRKKIRVDGKTYRVDLNCTTRGRRWCGRGLLDLSTVQAPLAAPVVSGIARAGDTLTSSSVAWVATPSATALTWRADGVVVGAGPSYQLTAADVGKRVTVTVSPSSGPYAQVASTSVPTAPVTS